MFSLSLKILSFNQCSLFSSKKLVVSSDNDEEFGKKSFNRSLNHSFAKEESIFRASELGKIDFIMSEQYLGNRMTKHCRATPIVSHYPWLEFSSHFE